MKKIDELITNFVYRKPFISPEEQNIDPETEKETKEYINYIFKQIKCICTAHNLCWPDMNTYLDAKRSWYRAFIIAELRQKELIERGIDKLRMQCGKDAKFVPTCGQFIEMCKPTFEELGFPDAEKAFIEASSNSNPSVSEKKWSHEVVRAAFQRTTSWALSHEPTAKIKPIFLRNYQDCCELFAQGKNLAMIGNDSPEHKRNLEKEEKVIAAFKEHFGHANSRKKAMQAMKDMLK